MNIQYYGHSCFKITTKPGGRATEEVVIFTDPFEKSIGLRPPQGNADILLISHNHDDHNNVSALKGNPIIIETPGEYSVQGINIVGIESFHDENEGEERGLSTIYLIETEDLKICHLGDLGTDLSPKQIEEINGVDILLTPVGGKYTIGAKKAAEISRKIEPSLIIPMHYKVPGLKLDIENEKAFCSEIGTCQKEKVSRLSIKKKDLEGKTMDVIVMASE